MPTHFHSFDANGYYTGSAHAPINPVTGQEASPNLEVATIEPPPEHDPATERARRVSGAWVVEAIPLPEKEPAPEPTHQCPRFFGNEKLDLFTPDEQLAVVTATMTDPVVKLMYDRLLGSAYLTYEDAETEQGLQLLVDKGLLTAARKVEIVARMTGQEI